MQQFKIFKDKFSRTLVSLGTRWIVAQNLPISYPSTTQTQIKHSLPTSFRFRANLKSKQLFQNSEEFKAKNQVLERNYSRSTIHHFHKRVNSIGFILAGNFFQYSPKFYLANLISNKKIDIDINKQGNLYLGFYGYASFYLFQINTVYLINR